MRERLLPTHESALSDARPDSLWEDVVDGVGQAFGLTLLRWFGPTLMLLALMALGYLVGLAGGPALRAELGVLPRTTAGLDGVVGMPLLHGSWQHLAGNAGAVLVLSPLAAVVSRRPWLLMTLCWLGSGLLTWCIGTPGAHIGASGIVYALVGFLLVYGFAARRWVVVVVGLLVAGPLLGGTLAGMIPQAGVSWTGHIAGALTGVAVALLFGRLDRPESGLRDELRAEAALPA